MCSLARFSRVRPTSVEPVKDSFRTRGSASIADTTVAGLSRGQHIHHAGRNAGLFHQGGDRERGQRGLAGRLQDDGAACGQRRADLAGGHGGGEVPRGDQHGDPDGLVDHDDLVRAAGSGLDIAADPDGLLGVPAEELRRVKHLTAGVGQRLAVLGGDQQRQFLDPINHQLVGPLQDLRPLPRRRLRPCQCGRGGGIDTGQGVVNAATGYGREDPAGCRIQHVEGRPVRSRAAQRRR